MHSTLLDLSWAIKYHGTRMFHLSFIKKTPQKKKIKNLIYTNKI